MSAGLPSFCRSDGADTKRIGCLSVNSVLSKSENLLAETTTGTMATIHDQSSGVQARVHVFDPASGKSHIHIFEIVDRGEFHEFRAGGLHDCREAVECGDLHYSVEPHDKIRIEGDFSLLSGEWHIIPRKNDKESHRLASCWIAELKQRGIEYIMHSHEPVPGSGCKVGIESILNHLQARGAQAMTYIQRKVAATDMASVLLYAGYGEIAVRLISIPSSMRLLSLIRASERKIPAVKVLRSELMQFEDELGSYVQSPQKLADHQCLTSMLSRMKELEQSFKKLREESDASIKNTENAMWWAGAARVFHKASFGVHGGVAGVALWKMMPNVKAVLKSSDWRAAISPALKASEKDAADLLCGLRGMDDAVNNLRRHDHNMEEYTALVEALTVHLNLLDSCFKRVNRQLLLQLPQLLESSLGSPEPRARL